MIRKHAVLPLLVLALVVVAGCRSAHVTSAILYIDQQMYQRAVDVLHEGLEYSPDEPEAFFYLGESHSHLAEEAVNDNDFLAAKRNYVQAFGYYQRAMEMDPSLQERVKTSLDYNYGLRKNDGLIDLDLANNTDGEMRDKYFESAEGQFRLAYAAYPDSTSPIKNIARMKIYQADLAAAAEDTERQQDMLIQSLELLDQVLEANPDAYALQADKADVLNKLGRNAEAGAIYDRLILEHPEDTELLLDIAGLATEEKNYERAADLYAQVAGMFESDDDLDNDEDIYPLTLQAANYYGSPGVLRYNAALNQFEKALRLEDSAFGGPKTDTLFQMQKLHYEYGSSLKDDATVLNDDARRQFEACVNRGRALVGMDAENEFGYYYLALGLTELGRVDEANSAMETYGRLATAGQ